MAKHRRAKQQADEEEVRACTDRVVVGGGVKIRVVGGMGMEDGRGDRERRRGARAREAEKAEWRD